MFSKAKAEALQYHTIIVSWVLYILGHFCQRVETCKKLKALDAFTPGSSLHSKQENTCLDYIEYMLCLEIYDCLKSWR